MKTLIVYASVHIGNTEKVAKEMAKVLNADITKAENLDINTIENYDLIGFGSGIYAGRFHKTMIDLVAKLPQMNNKKAFIFSTSGVIKASYNDKFKVLIEKHGFKVIDSFSCKGLDKFGPLKLIGGTNKGRPNDEDLKCARDFAKNLIK